MAAAVPFAVQGGIALYQHYKNKKANAQNASLQANSQGLAGQMAQGAQDQSAFGQPLLNSAAGYYQRLLHGDRASMQSAIAPEVAGITDVYRGATRNLERSGVQGAARDQATAELSRDRAGKISQILPTLRPQAAAATGDLGNQALSRMLTGQANAGNLYTNLLTGSNNRLQQTDQNDQAFSQSAGQLVAGLMKNQQSKKAGA